MKDKIEERIAGNKEEREKDNEVTLVDGEVETEDKKGFMEKMKEKLTGGGTEKETIPVGLEGKVLVEKIKGKLPGKGEDTEKVVHI